MNFHAFYADEMSSPAARREAEVIHQRQQEHVSQQQNLQQQSLHDESKSYPSTPLMGLTPRNKATTPLMGLTPRNKAKSSRKKKRIHEKRVKSELHDVMTRASDEMKTALQNQSGMMHGTPWLTPLQEKLRVQSTTGPVWDSRARSPTRGKSSSARRNKKNRHRRVPRPYVDPWSQEYVDKYEVGGPTAVQLSCHIDKRLERELSKILSLSSGLHADTMVSLDTLCGRCENQAKWLTHSDRARMFVFDDRQRRSLPETTASLSPSKSNDQDRRRLVYFRQNGEAEYIDLHTLTTPTLQHSRSKTTSPDNAFVGLVPRKSNMQIGIQNALANVITTGRSTQVPLSSKRRHGVERPPATASWCFPIANNEDTNILALLVVVMAKNPLTIKPSSSSMNNNGNNNNYNDSMDSDDTGSSSQDETSSNQSLAFDEDKYSIDEAILFNEFLTNVAIALRNCTKRNRELDTSAYETEMQRKTLQSQTEQAAMQRQTFQNQAETERIHFQTQLQTAQTKLQDEERNFQTQADMERKTFQTQLQTAQTKLQDEERNFKLQLQREEEQREQEFKAEREKEQQQLRAQREKEQQQLRATMEVEETKRRVEREAEKETLLLEREERKKEKEIQQKEMDSLREKHTQLVDAEKDEHHKLKEQEQMLSEAREALKKSKKTGEIHLGEIELEHKRILSEQVAQLESEVRRQKSRAVHARKAAIKSKGKLPVAMEALRRLSSSAYAGSGGDSNDEQSKAENIASLFRAIVDTTVNIVEAERVTLYLLSEDGTKLVGHQLGSHLTAGTKVDPNKKKLNIVCDRTVGICGHVATTRQLFNIRDVYDDVRFDRSVDMRTGFRTKSMLVCPIVSAHGNVLGVLQAMNKRFEKDDTKKDVKVDEEEFENEEDYFTKDDEQVIQMLSQHASMAIEHSRGIRDDHHTLQAAAKQLEAVQKELARHDNESAMLLDAAHDIAVELDYDELAMEEDNKDSITGSKSAGTFLVPMFAKIVAHARRLCHADRASLFFCDWEERRLWSVVAEGVTIKSSTGDGPSRPSSPGSTWSSQNRRRGQNNEGDSDESHLVIEVPMGRGVVGRVAETGKSLITANARSLAFFDDTHDMKSGYRTKSVLCVPVKLRTKGKDIVSAVLMLINKLNVDETNDGDSSNSETESDTDAVFDKHDLDLAERLAAQVSGPVAHAKELIQVAKRNTGNDKQKEDEIRKSMKETEKKATKQLKKIESTLRNRVADERSRAGKMLNILSLGAAVANKGDVQEHDVGSMLSNVLDEVREVMDANSVTFHMRDRERKILWPRSSSSGSGSNSGNAAAISGNGTTSLTDGGGGNRATANVAKAVVTSSIGREICRRTCAMTGETVGKTISEGQKGENGIDVLCVPVMGRDKDGKEVILGVLEAVYPTPTDVIGEETTDSVFLNAVCAQVGAVLMEESKARSRAEGEERAAKDMQVLREQIAKIKEEEKKMGTKLQKERRLSKAAKILNQNVGKHGVMADLFGRSVAAVTGLVNADRGSLFLVDGTKGMLRTTNMHVSDEDDDENDKDTTIEFIEIPIQPNSIAGSCAITGCLTNVPDAYRDARFHRGIDLKTGYRTKSMLTVPIFAVSSEVAGEDIGTKSKKKSKKSKSKKQSKGKQGADVPQVIAILQLINKKEDGSTNTNNTTDDVVVPFDAEDVELVKRFVLQMAPSIRDALQQESAAHEVAASHQHLREIEARLTKEREVAEKRQMELESAKQQAERNAKQNALKADKVAQIISEKNQKLEHELKNSQQENIQLKQSALKADKVGQIINEKYQRLEQELKKSQQQNIQLNQKVLILQKEKNEIITRHNETQQEYQQHKDFTMESENKGRGAIENETRKREEIERRMFEVLEREKELQTTNRHLMEQAVLIKSNISSSPNVHERRNITRVGKVGMQKLMQSDDGDNDNGGGGGSGDSDDYDRSESRLSARKRKKKKKITKKKKKKRTNKKIETGEKGSGLEKPSVVLRFGPSSVVRKKKKATKRKKMIKRSRKKKPTASLSSEFGGPVIVTIDRSLFTNQTKKSPKKRTNRFFGSPFREERQKTPSSGRLIWGFAPPPESFTPEKATMQFR